MRKLIKSILIVFCSVIFIIIIGAIALLLWVDPNNLKNPLKNAVYNATGKEIAIEGDINWTFFPQLTLEVNDVHLKNPSSFSTEPMAKLDQANISIHILPLLKGEIKTKHIKLIGLNLHAETLKNGQSNWNSLLILPATHSNPIPPSEEKAAPTQQDKKDATFVLHINKITVVNSRLHWKNLQHPSQGSLHLRQLVMDNLSTDGAEFTLALDASFKTNKNPDKTTIKFTSRNQFDLQKQTLAVIYKSTVNGKINTDGELQINFAKPLSFAGNVNVINNKTSQISCLIKGDDNAIHFNQCNIQHDNHQLQANLQLIDWRNQRNMRLQGDIHAKQLHLGRITMQNVHSPVTMQNQRWQFNPIRADLYLGKYQGQLSIDTRGSQITYQLMNQTVTDVQLAALLQDLNQSQTSRTTLPSSTKLSEHSAQLQALMQDINQSQKMSGTLSAKANLRTQGTTSTTIKKNLNGNLNFTITQGNIQGLNVISMMQSAYAQFKRKGTPKISSGTTAFSKLSAKFNIHKGIAKTKDLNLSSPLVYITSAGTVNLVNKKIDFNAEVRLNDDTLPDIEFLQQQAGGAIPFRVTGTIDDPNIQPDMQGLFKMIGGSGLQKKLEKKAGDAFKSFLNN